jgi:hypothetical protein
VNRPSCIAIGGIYCLIRRGSPTAPEVESSRRTEAYKSNLPEVLPIGLECGYAKRVECGERMTKCPKNKGMMSR